ncbi:MAG: M48 family metalloprotease, partial [Planctomycetota bacterium]
MAKKLAPDFYDVQRQQRRKSLFVFFILILFYFVAVGVFSAIVLFVGTSFGKEELLAGSFLTKLLLFNTALATLIASFHFYEARKFGAKFILKRLMARPPS